MKLNHFFVAALALGLTHSFVLAGEGESQVGGSSGGGEKKEVYPTTTKAGTTKPTAGTHG